MLKAIYLYVGFLLTICVSGSICKHSCPVKASTAVDSLSATLKLPSLEVTGSVEREEMQPTVFHFYHFFVTLHLFPFSAPFFLHFFRFLSFPSCTRYKISGRQWPSGLRRGSADDRLLELRVRIPLEAWLSVPCECFVFSGRGLRQTDPQSREVLPTVLCHCVI